MWKAAPITVAASTPPALKRPACEEVDTKCQQTAGNSTSADVVPGEYRRKNTDAPRWNSELNTIGVRNRAVNRKIGTGRVQRDTIAEAASADTNPSPWILRQ